MHKATILATCAGSGVGQSVIDSLNLVSNYKVIGCDVKENVYAYNNCHEFYIAPNLTSPDYLDYLIELCQKRKIDIIIPGHDKELMLFGKNRERFAKAGIEVVVSDPDIVEISRDKYRWAEYFKKFGCSVVSTKTVAEFRKNIEDDFFPAIVKPIGGSASQGIKIVHSIEEIVGLKDEDIIQPYLFPNESDENYDAIKKAVGNKNFLQLSEISIQLVFTKNSRLENIFISKNKLKNGVPILIEPISVGSFKYIDEIKKFAEILIDKNVIGPVNLQGRVVNNRLIFFEMNMRFTGITGTRAKLGFNEVDFLISNFLGKESKLLGYTDNKIGVRQVACATVPKNKTKNLNNNTYTILGAGGYIGTYFTKELILSDAYNEINIICRKESFAKYTELYSDDKRVNVVKETDLLLESYYAQSDIVINFASSRANKPDEDIYNSILFQHRQSTVMKKLNIPFLLNISSQSVYDQSLNIEKNEETEVVLKTAYAFQKYIGEELFKEVHNIAPSTKVLSLRLSRVFGSGYDQPPVGFFAHILDAFLNNKKIEIPNPENRTNLIDIRDVVDCIFHFVKTKKKNLPNIINVGGTNISIKEYCEKVFTAIDVEVKFEDVIKYGNSDEVVQSSCVDTKLLNDLGWKPKISIMDSIKDIATYYK